MPLPPPGTPRAFRPVTTGERVIDIVKEPDGTITVTTKCDNRRSTYRVCKPGYPHLGGYVQPGEPIRHRTASYTVSWSPWDGVDDGD